ncbi:hypothetical protein IE077_000233, partial [Cardiosporidium cionae]
MTAFMNTQREKKRRLDDCVVNTNTSLTAHPSSVNPFLSSPTIAKQKQKTMEHTSHSISTKNIILAGPQSVCIHDPCMVSPRDLGSNFYLSEEDIIKKRTRAEGCYEHLQELNHYVSVSSYKGDINE